MVVAVAAGMQPNLTFDPRQPAETITAFIVQVSLGTCPTGASATSRSSPRPRLDADHAGIQPDRLLPDAPFPEVY